MQNAQYTHNKYEGEPRQNSSEMTSLFNNGGFTLIELLVVVLIIGVLAAVAVSQYKVAVVKSRVASILPIVATLQKAEAVYYLANGSHTTAIQELDVDIPCTEVTNAGGTPFWKCGNDFLVQVSSTGAYASYCPDHNDSSVEDCMGHRDMQIAFNHIYTSAKGSRYCVVKNGSSLGEAVCKRLGEKVSGDLYLMP